MTRTVSGKPQAKCVLSQSGLPGLVPANLRKEGYLSPNTHRVRNCGVYKKHPLKRFSYWLKAHYEDFLAYVAVYSSSKPIMLILNCPPPNSEMNFTEH